MSTQPRHAGQRYLCYKCQRDIPRGTWYTTYTPLFQPKRYYHLECEGGWGKYMAQKLAQT